METLLLQYGYLMLFVASILEGQLSTLICGFLIWTGHFDLLTAFSVIVLADITNDSIYYRIGRKLFKIPRVEAFLDRSHFLSHNLKVVKKFWFEHPFKTALFGKNAYIISVAIIGGAGVVKLPYGRFLAYTVPTSLLQPIILLFLGYYLGNGYKIASQYLQYPGIIIAVIIILILILYRQKGKYMVKQFEA